MEMSGVRNESFGGAIRQAGAGEMSVIESESQTGNTFHQAQRGFWLGNDRADVSFDAEDQTVSSRLLNAPREFVTRALPGIRCRLVIETNAGQGRHVFGARGMGVVQRF